MQLIGQQLVVLPERRIARLQRHIAERLALYALQVRQRKPAEIRKHQVVSLVAVSDANAALAQTSLRSAATSAPRPMMVLGSFMLK